MRCNVPGFLRDDLIESCVLEQWLLSRLNPLIVVLLAGERSNQRRRWPKTQVLAGQC